LEGNILIRIERLPKIKWIKRTYKEDPNDPKWDNPMKHPIEILATLNSMNREMIESCKIR
jgi:hypothetical protein